MATFSRRQWTAITLGTALFASLFFINRKPPKTEAARPQQGGHAASMNLDSVFEQSEAQISYMIKARVEKIKDAISGATQQVQAKLLDSIINIYDSIGAQIPATLYTEKLATLQNSAGLWYQAGDRYYKCVDVVNSSARTPLLQKAMDCFDNAIKIDPNNLEAKVGKGECIVQGGGSPMEGIAMIEGVLKVDSNNEKAQVALGSFSIQSGQYAKAIARFNRVLKIDPSFTDAYLYLAQAYESSGNKPSAIGYLKKYSTFARDSAVKIQINDYIKKLENDTTETKKK
jgi:tetratricopeptide (TPR) repeat protein